MKILLYISMMLLSVAVGLSGCKDKIPSSGGHSVLTESKDSSWTVERVRIDTVTIPGDSLSWTMFIECDTVTNLPRPRSSSFRSGRMSGTARIDSAGTLTTDCKADSLQVLLERKERDHYQLVKQFRAEIQKVPEYRTHWYDTAARWLAVIFLLLVTIKLIIR